MGGLRGDGQRFWGSSSVRAQFTRVKHSSAGNWSKRIRQWKLFHSLRLLFFCFTRVKPLTDRFWEPWNRMVSKGWHYIHVAAGTGWCKFEPWFQTDLGQVISMYYRAVYLEVTSGSLEYMWTTRGGGGGGGTPLYLLYGDVPLDRVWFSGIPVLNRVYNSRFCILDRVFIPWTSGRVLLSRVARASSHKIRVAEFF